MQRTLSEFSQRTYDVAIIGGGINGAATGREAALEEFACCCCAPAGP
jgi:glycerol-3-phosphate dehydrogenase